MDRGNCDIVIVGMGLGAAAIAKRLAQTGSSIAMLPGAGHARFKHLEGGVVDPAILREAFGDISTAPLTEIGTYHVFRRDELEEWAIHQLGDSVAIVSEFEEALTIPHDTGKTSLLDDSGKQKMTANLIVLTEGANPKIGIAARLRQDFDPEDMIHFGRTMVPGARIEAPVTGSWRTASNMPARYILIPQAEGASVSVSVRIENVMRAGRDGRAVLAEFLASEQARELGIPEEHGEIGMELVPLLPDRGRGMIGAHNIMISLDANGVIDARSLRRYDAMISAGREMGSMMAREWPHLVEWHELGVSMWDVFTSGRRPYHEDSNTGFIEDGPGRRRGLLSRLFNRKPSFDPASFERNHE